MRIFLFVLVALLPLPALAAHIDPPGPANAWDYYVIAGNVPVIAALLESIKAMTSPSTNPEFRTLVATFASIGFFGVVFTSIRGGPERIGKYIVGIWLLTYALFSLTLDLVVTDETNSATQLVKDVPAAVGLPATAVATVGHWLTEKTELFFALPNYDGLKLSQGAFINMNAMMLDALHKVQITDPQLRDGITHYVDDCVIPAIISLKIDPKTMLQSKDLWKEFGNAKHNSIYTTWYGNFDTCAVAYTDLTNKINTYAPSLIKGMGESFSFLDATGAGASYLQTALDSSLAWSSAAGGTGNTYALQQGMITEFRHSYQNAASALGANEQLLSLNIEQAKEAQKTGWYTTAELFREAVMNMYAVMQAFIIGLAPIVMAAAVLPKVGFALMKGWAEVLVWLALWAPAFALVNFLMAVREQTSYQQILGGGLTLMSEGAMSEATVSFVGQANLLMTMVPAILWGLVKGGSVAMTSVMERASGASQAGGAAQKTAEGSFSGGNVSYNNMNADHHDLSQSRAYGVQPATLHNSAGATNEIIGMSGHQTQIGGIVQRHDRSVTDSASRKQALTEAWAKQEEAAHAVSGAASVAYRQIASAAQTAGHSTSGGASLQHGNVQSQQTANQVAFESIYNHLASSTKSKEQAFAITASAALRSGGYTKEADEIDSAHGDKDKITGILSGLKPDVLRSVGISSVMEARYTGRDAVGTADTLGTGQSAKTGSTDGMAVGSNSAQGTQWSDVNTTGNIAQTGRDFASGVNFQTLDAAATKYMHSAQVVDAAERNQSASETRTIAGSLRPDELDAVNDKYSRRVGAVDAAMKTGDLPKDDRRPTPPLTREVGEQRKNEEAAATGMGALAGQGGAGVYAEARDAEKDAKTGTAEAKREAAKRAADDKRALDAVGTNVDNFNNNSLTAAGQHLKAVEDMGEKRGMMFAAAGGIYAADKLPFGPVGNAIGGAIAAGGIYMINKVANDETQAETKDIIRDSELKAPRDIQMGNHVIGKAAGFALDKDGHASTIYRYETGEKDAEGHRLTAFGVWKEGQGFMKIDGLDFGDKKPGQPAGVNYSGGTEWKEGHEPNRK